MYPDSWIYRGFTSCNFDLWLKQNGGHGSDLRKIHGFKYIIYAQTALIWKFYNAVCTATSTFDKWHDIRCLRAEFTAKHGKAPLSLTTHRWMEPDLCSWQSPDISRSRLYRGTITWTPPTAIYRAYTVVIWLWHPIMSLGHNELREPLSYKPFFLDPRELLSCTPIVPWPSHLRRWVFWHRRRSSLLACRRCLTVVVVVDCLQTDLSPGLAADQMLQTKISC